VRVLYFAWVRELVGMDEEALSPPPGVDTVAALVGWLSARSEGDARAFADPSRLRAAVDGAFVPLSAPIGDAREVALFPPVTGG
jgi:molybdopterin synthase sulfur carrier subunit